jgi:hypothetical protein
MTPGDVMLWALAAFVVVVLASIALALVVGVYRQLTGKGPARRARVTRINSE